MTFEKAVEQLEAEVENAFEVARANKESGSPAESVAYDQGRITGLRDALEIFAGVEVGRTSPGIDEALNRGDGSYRP